MLTGDDRYLDVWRKQMAAINSHAKVVDGRTLYPHMYGAQGWHDYQPSPYAVGADELWYWSMKDEDRRLGPRDDWYAFLDGKATGYPEQALRAEFSRIRARVEAIRQDTSTADTRLADDPLVNNPATVDALLRLVMGGISPGNRGTVLHCRVRYFDPDGRRPGLPPDVAALVEGMTADSTTLRLVNLCQTAQRTVIVQSGAYGEHVCESVMLEGREVPVGSASFSVRLAPGAGSQLVLKIRRYVSVPTLMPPWGR
jgi:hypothetical protein